METVKSISDRFTAKLGHNGALGAKIQAIEDTVACDVCGDLGYVIPDVRPSDPRFGRVIPCTCQTAVINRRLWNESGLTGAERQWALDYAASYSGKAEAIRTAQKITRLGKGLAVIFGDYGVGKSGLLKAAVATRIRSGQGAVYRRAEDILREARAEFDAGPDRSNVFDLYGSIPFLALDEVDRVSMSEWARAYLFTLLDERYNRRHENATILSTNADVTEWKGSWAYLKSRLMDGIVVYMEGPTLRGIRE